MPTGSSTSMLASWRPACASQHNWLHLTDLYAGTLPAEWSGMGSLTTFWLTWNHLHDIPDAWQSRQACLQR